MWNMCLNFECISAECFEQSLRTLFKVWACTKGGEESIYTGLKINDTSPLRHLMRVMREHDLTNKRQRQRMILDTCYTGEIVDIPDN